MFLKTSAKLKLLPPNNALEVKISWLGGCAAAYPPMLFEYTRVQEHDITELLRNCTELFENRVNCENSEKLLTQKEKEL